MYSQKTYVKSTVWKLKKKIVLENDAGGHTVCDQTHLVVTPASDVK